MDHKAFTRRAFRIGIIAGTLAAVVYAAAVTVWFQKWDSATLFQTFVIFWALVYIAPYFAATMKKLDVSLDLGYKSSSVLESVQQKIEPIIEDVRVTAQKVREAIQGMNIRSEIERVEQSMVKIESHLKRLADVYASKKPFPTPQELGISVSGKPENGT